MLFTIAIALLLSQEIGQGPQPAASAANATNPGSRPAEKCSVEGKAVNAATGEPLKKAHITLQSSNGDNFNTTFSVTTGPDGAFTLKDVDAGIYRLNGNRTGYAPTAYGAKKLSGGGTQIHLTPGQALKDVVLRMQPQSVVAGRITDSDGEPVANVLVSIVRTVWRNGQRSFLDAGGANSNDLGEYRVFGLSAGKYRIRATLRNFAAVNDPEEYAPTWYPGQTDAAAASLIDLQPGQTLRGIDMIVLQTPTRRVRGKVVVGAARADFIQLMANGRDPSGVSGMRRVVPVRPAKPDFQLHLAAGSYTISAFCNDNGVTYSGVTQVDVGDSDIDNVVVNLQAAAEVAGRVLIEGATDLSGLAKSNVRVQLYPRDVVVMFNGSQAASMSADGAFTLKNVGPQAMNVYVSGLPDGYYVKSISYGQQDAKTNGLSYTGSNDAVDILVSPHGATVSGVVHNHAGDPVGGATVVLVPPKEQRSNTRNFRIAQTDQTGKFTLKSVEPNDYTVFAWEDIEPGAYMDPDALKAAENRGKALKLEESSQESLDIESIPAEDAPAAAGF